MIIFVRALIVIASVLGGFVMAGGHIGSLMHLSERVIIAGAALGASISQSGAFALAKTLNQQLQHERPAQAQKTS